MSRSFTPAPGYVPCACRDCCEIAIGKPGALCHECDDAGCAPERECQAADAYGGEAEPITEREPSAWHRAVEQQGFAIVSEGSNDPQVVLPRVLAALEIIAPAAHAFLTTSGRVSRIPAEALASGQHPFWSSEESDAALAEIFVALDERAPAGTFFGAEGEIANLRLGFFRS